MLYTSICHLDAFMQFLTLEYAKQICNDITLFSYHSTLKNNVALSIKKYLALGKYSKFFKLNISE